MCENVNINVQETNETINIVSSEIQEVIDINVFETTEDVTLNITEEIIQVNINKVTGGGGEETLAETLVFGNNTGGTDILLNNDDKIQLENNSSLRKGTYDFGQNGGISRICGVDYEDMWQGGIRHVFDTNGFIRNSTNGFNTVPNFSFDVTLRFKVGSIWTLDDGTNYICTDNTEGAAVWELYNVIPTSTSDLTNDGEDGVNPFITAADVPASVTSVGLTMPSAFSVANSPITSAGTLEVTGAGLVSQYVRGDGSLANFPTSTGGGASLSFYLNGSVSQGTIGGVAFREMDRTPILGAGTDFTINANGYIQSFITDANVPNLLEIPAGNWNFETYFSASSGGGSPRFYIELYKWNGTTLSLIASNSASPRLISDGTNIEAYFSALAVPQTTLLATDRLAVRIYVTPSGRTITLHTENSHLCQVITTFSTGITALNGLTTQVQSFATGTSGTDFAISSATATHTFNLPTASAANRGALSSTDWTTFNNKQNALTNPVTGTGASGQVAFWNGTNTQTGSNNFTFSNDRLTINRTSDSRIFLQENGVTNLQLQSISALSRLSSNNGNLALATGGGDRLLVFLNGNIGINTTTDAGFRLDVNGTARVQGQLTMVGNIIPSAGATYNVGSAGAPFSNGIFINVVYSNQFASYNSHLFLANSGVNFARFTNTTGNFIIQNGGTYTDIASARLTVNSTTQGFLPPRMTTTQKNAIATPAAGLVVYDTTLNKLCLYTTTWETITSL
jgi:hypothetical protein